MSDYPMLISNKLHSFRNFVLQRYEKYRKPIALWILTHRVSFCKAMGLLFLSEVLFIQSFS